jgi:DivIVA domain-containing protein
MPPISTTDGVSYHVPMELSPQAVAAATFKTVKRGYDPDEVRSYLVEVATALEASHQQATAMEARARAAIAKLQEATQQGAVAAASSPRDDAEVISRTLVLAQRTADAAIAEARAEAAQITERAGAEANAMRQSAAAEAQRLLAEANAEAERVKSDEQRRAEDDVARIAARRDALLADVEQLEHHAVAQRERVRHASMALLELADSVSDGSTADITAGMSRPGLGEALPAPTGPSSGGIQRIPLAFADDDDTADLTPPAGIAAGDG